MSQAFDPADILARIERDARLLLGSADPLMHGQYLHLLGRVTAMLDVVRADGAAEAVPESRAPRAGRLAGLSALVTGGASGLGAATVRRFHAEGAQVAIADIDAEAARALAQEIGAGAIALVCDHRDDAQNRAAVAATCAAFGRLDILHNNAGGPFAGSFESADDATIERVIGVNLVGAMRMTRAALPALRAAATERPGGAAILFTSSLQGIKARPNFSVYTVAKHGIVGLVRSLALELAPANIRVNAICPTVTETPMLPQFLPGMAQDLDEARRRFRASIPLGRMPEPLDTANAALFLASEEARMITGIALPVDGGQMAG